MPYTDDELSGICYEITGFMSHVMDDVFMEAERQYGDAITLGSAYVDVVALVSAFSGNAGANILGVVSEIIVTAFSRARERELRELKADISTVKIEIAICDLYAFLKQDGFSYQTLLDWSEYQIQRGHGDGFNLWASIITAITDDSGFWTKRAEIGVAQPHGKAGKLCGATPALITPQPILYAENGSAADVVPVEAPNATTFRLDGKYYDSTTNTRLPLAAQPITPSVGATDDIIVYRWEFADQLPGYGYVSFAGAYNPVPGTDTFLYYSFNPVSQWQRTSFPIRDTQLQGDTLNCQQVSKFGFEPHKLTVTGNTLSAQLAADPTTLPCDGNGSPGNPIVYDGNFTTNTASYGVLILADAELTVGQPLTVNLPENTVGLHCDVYAAPDGSTPYSITLGTGEIWNISAGAVLWVSVNWDSEIIAAYNNLEPMGSITNLPRQGEDAATPLISPNTAQFLTTFKRFSARIVAIIRLDE